MSKHDREITDTSRRGFTKSLAAALATAPALIGLAACGRDDTRRTADGTTSSAVDQLPRKKPCVAGLALEPHEPPIGIYDGSLVINVPQSNRITRIEQTTGPRPFKHTFGGANYTSIDEVTVLTRPGSGRPFFMRYALPANPTYQLRIWLIQLTSAGGGALQNEFDNPGTEPHLILKPTAPHIESVAQLVDAGFSHKVSGPLRYDYPAMARHFHIGKWQISDTDGTPVQDAATEELFQDQLHDSYEIFVSFNHP